MAWLPGTPAARFRFVAIAEAISWAGLLVGMFFKYVVIEHEIGVQVFGPVHGAIFMAYVLVTLATWGALRWSTGTGVLAVLASVPPFGSWAFERWAARRGRLDPAPA
jgi:integral membrane protein